MDDCSHRDVTDRECAARTNFGRWTIADLVAGVETFRRKNVALFAIVVMQQCNTAGAVRVIFYRRNGGGNAVLVALEVDLAVALLVAATTVTAGLATVVVTTTGLVLWGEQRLLGRSRG